MKAVKVKVEKQAGRPVYFFFRDAETCLALFERIVRAAFFEGCRISVLDDNEGEIINYIMECREAGK